MKERFTLPGCGPMSKRGYTNALLIVLIINIFNSSWDVNGGKIYKDTVNEYKFKEVTERSAVIPTSNEQLSTDSFVINGDIVYFDNYTFYIIILETNAVETLLQLENSEEIATAALHKTNHILAGLKTVTCLQLVKIENDATATKGLCTQISNFADQRITLMASHPTRGDCYYIYSNEQKLYQMTEKNTLTFECELLLKISPFTIGYVQHMAVRPGGTELYMTTAFALAVYNPNQPFQVKFLLQKYFASVEDGKLLQSGADAPGQIMFLDQQTMLVVEKEKAFIRVVNLADLTVSSICREGAGEGLVAGNIENCQLKKIHFIIAHPDSNELLIGGTGLYSLSYELLDGDGE